MSTPLTTQSPSPSRIVISPDSPIRLDKSPLGRAQRTYSSEGKSFKPTNLHPTALLDADERTSAAVRKQLVKGSADLEASIAKLTALRLEEGKGATLFSPRPMPAARAYLRYEEDSPMSRSGASSAAVNSTDSKVEKE